MGIFDKIKNMFTEEVEEDELKVEKIKKEVTQVPIESPNRKEESEEEFFDNFSFKTEEKVSTPVFFDDNDFDDLNLKEEKKEIEKIPEPPKKELYSNRLTSEKLEVKEKKSFKPTPIISPVYGVLNKNYHKEDIISRSDVKIDRDNIDSSIDTIRNKAYGTLEDELENTLFGSNSILFKKDEDENESLIIEEVEDDVLTNLTDDISKELDELLIRKEKYVNDVEEEKTNSNIDDDLLGFIDSTLYKEGVEDNDD